MKTLEQLVRPNIRALKPYSTARDEYAGGEITTWLDANENPYENGVNRYPDPHQKELKRRIAALKGGCDIVTDTQMAKAGINKTILASLGGEVHCFMSDPDVAQEARSRGVTRAFVSMEKAAALEKPCIFAIGNAPTALLSLEQLMEEGKAAPALIIGVPVGFVNVEISEERIIEKARAPYIVARGRKGGSNVAAAICNALLYQIRR